MFTEDLENWIERRLATMKNAEIKEAYQNVTIAGFHALHRVVWAEIVESLKSDDPLSKEEVFLKLNIVRVSCDCFACEVGRGLAREEGKFHYKCYFCPVREWRNVVIEEDMDIGCDKGNISPDFFCDSTQLDEALHEINTEDLIEFAEYVRDVEWKDSNKVIYEKGEENG